MNIKETLFGLASKQGVSGDEKTAAQFALKALEAFADEVKTDKMGNVVGELSGDGRHILIDAHIDQIGLIVTAIDDEGFLRVAKCGGSDNRVMAGCEVTVFGKEPVFGVVACTPPHLLKDGDGKKAKGFEELVIDVGLDAEKAKEFITPGDRITIKGYQESLIGSRITAPALDDRAGVAVLLRCLEILKEKGVKRRLTVLFSAQEEVRGAGAKTAAFSTDADCAVSVDVSFAMSPGCQKEKCADMGKGAMIGIAPTLSNRISNKLIALAKEHEIPYQLEVMGGATGTNADEISSSKGGKEMGLISIPLKYMHTGVEVIDMDDVESVSRLLAQFIIEEGGLQNA